MLNEQTLFQPIQTNVRDTCNLENFHMDAEKVIAWISISLPIWANLGIHVKGKLSTSLKGPKIENTPPKNNMEHNHGGLEDNVPFNMGDL